MKTNAQYAKEWRKRNPDYQKKYNKQNRKKILKQRKKLYDEMSQEDIEKRRERNRKLVAKRKMEGLIHYGGNPPKCACCGETEVMFLSLDHINGGGYKHRKETRTNLWTVLAQQGWPDGYRILCFNCNLCLGFNGYCPHEKKSVII